MRVAERSTTLEVSRYTLRAELLSVGRKKNMLLVALTITAESLLLLVAHFKNKLFLPFASQADYYTAFK